MAQMDHGTGTVDFCGKRPHGTILGTLGNRDFLTCWSPVDEKENNRIEQEEE